MRGKSSYSSIEDVYCERNKSRLITKLYWFVGYNYRATMRYNYRVMMQYNYDDLPSYNKPKPGQGKRPFCVDLTLPKYCTMEAPSPSKDHYTDAPRQGRFSKGNSRYEPTHTPRPPLTTSRIGRHFQQESGYHQYSQMGYEHPVKSNVLTRFRTDLSLPANMVNISQFPDIWVDEFLLPIFSSGNFSSAQKKPHGSVGGRGGSRSGQRGKGRAVSTSDQELSQSYDNSSNFARRMKEFTPPAQAEEEADEEVLWNMPQDEDALGTFDEKGNFTIGGPERANAFSMEDFRLSSSVPGHDRLPPPSSKTPLVSADTKWYYRDPSGQIQGPFPTKKMLHWYSRKYFPETLPLRRAQDILFEPMSEWKSKCGGVCPFEIAEIVDESPTSTFTSPALSPRSGESITACPNDPAMFVNKQEATAPVVNAFAKLGLSWTGQGQAPDTTEGANHGLAEDQLCFLQQFKAKSSGSGGGWKKVEGVSAIPIDIAPSSAPRPTAVPTPKPLVSPLELVPAASPTVGWSKPVANSRPLSEIMAEEAQMELSRRASQPKGGAPKSFAETLCLNGGGVEVARPPPPPRQVIVKSPTATTAAMAMATTTAVAPPKPFSSSKPTTATEKSPLESNPTADIKNWCIGRLRAVEGTYDVNICTICLMDQKTPADVLGFVEANMATNKMDMKAFANEFIERRFGMMAGRASVGEGKKPVMAEEEFITVGRKQHRKK